MEESGSIKYQGKTALTFRNLRDEQDYPLLLELNRSSRAADKDEQPVSLAAIAHALANMDGLTPQAGVIIACLDDVPVGYSRLGWYSSRPETRLYYQISFLRKEYRKSGAWSGMVRNNERCLRDVAAGHPHTAEMFFQAWSSDRQKDWVFTLEAEGYRVTRRFNNMLFRLGEVPQKTLPGGLEIRPGTRQDMRAVWEALKEMNAGLFENVVQDWLDEKFPAWLENPANDPCSWQVAWDGEQLAGIMLAHIDQHENQERQRKHGYTEHIYVRPGWRGRGLASALISRGLQVLKDQGIEEAELGVDSENESAAFRLYAGLGYQTFSVDTWFRKPLD